MKRAEKEKLVEVLRSTFQEATLVVVTRPVGMTVAESSRLRRQVREAGAGFKVTKNRLARIALEGTAHEGLVDLFTGPTAVAFSKDPVAAAKVTVEYANRNDKFSIIGGGLSGSLLDEEGVKSLAKLPSLDELRSKLLGLLPMPATQLVRVLPAPAQQIVTLANAPGGKLARVFQARAMQGDAA